MTIIPFLTVSVITTYVNSVPIPQLLGGSLDLNAGNLEAPVNDGLVDNLLGNLTY
ncbi:hypothetical protein WALSEDRAFT_62473 [Wallemia mellicola CBS 633.66]|uniref:Uncharacterized protein n=1 Tax=Wallemia mellicola (strain ATCC MYA-4683 / CBS 633.66) TaxID=671144 RepID=I4YIL2_WALMC|nr:hypothetical protein WALSEDRAFT_62473 [Wallemia mellicola CBS 633.66]EIM23804.1 hypothetical protein WALSEDRAFT_62473 [Wallemia mellicola CBS 633.66]|eukprot:XP_006956467.1 hypothetical protein WALSEDRAFT_62473 [Wallemia mellicola CBS 633.66]